MNREVQVEDRRQIELPALADDELGCVADPALIRCARRELPIEQIPRLSLPEIRYLLWSLSLRAWTDTVRQSMPALLVALLAALQSVVRSRLELGAEILALRHQLAVLQRQTPKRPRLGHADRWLWVLLSRVWWNWRSALQLVRPDTVVRWHRRGFARYWRWRSSRRRPGRPALAVDVRALIQQMHGAHPRWGAPRVHGELRKLGLHIAQATVAKYLAAIAGRPRPRRGGPSSPTTPPNSRRVISSRHPRPRFGSCVCSWCYQRTIAGASSTST